MISAGFYRVDITPPLDAPVVGSWTDLDITGYSGPLMANALVLEDGCSKTAIVSVEIAGIENGLCDQARREIESRCGIPYERIILCSTHVHSGPKTTEEADDHYSQQLVMKIVTAVWMAQKRLREVRIGVGRADNEQFVHNRRLTGPDGEIAMNWFHPDTLKDCVEDMENRDTAVIVMRFESPEGEVLGFIVNYSNHNNAMGGTEVNGDFGAVICDKLRALYGEQVITLVLLGACGDVNWVDYRDMTRPENPLHHRRIAESLLGNVLDICSRLEYPQIDKIGAKYKKLIIREREFNDYDSVIDRTFNYQPQGGLEVEQEKLRGRPLRDRDVHVSLITFGDQVAIATVNGEIFSRYGLMFKKDSGYPHSMLVELTNGNVNYIPTPDAYAKGGYEVRRPATELEYDAGERVYGAMMELLSGK